ncbi:MAG: AAA family ATPase [Crocinitomicaceae bacterium]|nr:AAA family ATPase [Crocinitomicaceae bacterium]
MNLNPEILERSETSEDVNILVGINGSGKSTYLNELSKYFLNRGNNVIAIANTIFDKFNSRDRNFNILRHSRGKGTVKRTIRDVFESFHNRRERDVYGLSSVFEYVGFETGISVKIVGLRSDYEDQLVGNKHLFEDHEIHDILAFLREYIEIQGSYSRGYTFSISHGWKDLRSLDYLKILNFESKLRKAKVLNRIELFFKKEGAAIPITSASSGELSILISMMFINANIDRKTVILIDEPENSLHPKWQKDFIQRIMDLFHRYEPKIIVATHSPLIITGAESTLDQVKVFKANFAGDFVSFGKRIMNVEEIYDDYFDVITPQNRFLSTMVIDKLNLLYADKMKIDDFISLMQEQIDNSFDDIQKGALQEVIKLANDR